MENYLDFVESAARDGQDKIFFNSGPNHAAIVMSRIFKYSKEVVKIYCGGFNGTISNDEDYLKYLEVYLFNGGKLEIIVEQNLSNGPSKIFKVLKKYPNNISIFQTNSRITDSTTMKPIHFTIGDNKMTRVETDTTDYTAQVNFGSQSQAEMLNIVFEKINNKPKTPISLARSPVTIC